MFNRVQTRTLGKHPTGENAADAAVKRYLVNFQKRCCLGFFSRRTGIANPWRDLQLTELDGLIHIDIKSMAFAGDLVDSGEDGNLVFDARSLC